MGLRSHLALGFAGDGQEEFELGGQLILGVESIREVDSADAAVGVDLNSADQQEKKLNRFKRRGLRNWWPSRAERRT